MHQDNSLLPQSFSRYANSNNSNTTEKRRKSRSEHRAKSEIRPLDSDTTSSNTGRGKSLVLLPESQYSENSRNQRPIEPLYKFPAALLLRLLCAKRNKAWPQTRPSPCVKLVNIECPQGKYWPKRQRNSGKFRTLTAVSPLMRRISPAPSGGFISRRLKGVQPRERAQPLRVRLDAVSNCL
jgi:hypothetical protein